MNSNNTYLAFPNLTFTSPFTGDVKGREGSNCKVMVTRLGSTRLRSGGHKSTLSLDGETHHYVEILQKQQQLLSKTLCYN